MIRYYMICDMLFFSWLRFLCSFRRIYHITHDFNQLCKKLIAALIVTGKCGAETIADDNSKTMEHIPLNVFP